MSLTARETGGAKHDPIPAGTYTAICYAVADLGTHFDERFKKDVHRVLVQWEIPDERIMVEKRDGRQADMPRAISRKYTMSLHSKSALRHDLEAWRGRRFTDEELRGFDLRNILGAACLLGIVHEPRKDGQGIFATISSIMAIPTKRGVKPEKPPVENELVAFEIPDNAEPMFPIDDRLPEWVREIIMESDEYTGRNRTEPTTGGDGATMTDEQEPPADGGDDLPF